MNKKIFDQEISMCRKLYKKSKGCNWGKCSYCGALPLLHKLYAGEVIEDKKDIDKIKKELLGK